MSKVEYVALDDPFLTLRYEGKEYVYNPEYGSLLDLKTDKLVENMPKDIQEFLSHYYSVSESLGLY